MIRLATLQDVPGMVTLLNAIIARGGTTAHQTPYDNARMTAHYVASSVGIATQVAVIHGKIAGFQSLEWPDPHGDPMPDNWAVIATFVDTEMAGRGVGKALFAATRTAAQDAGVQTIDATIRADNSSGLGYYGAMGFQDYDRLIGVPLMDGTPVDRIRKRFDL